MEGVIEVNPGRLATLYANGLELPYVEFGSAEPALKLVHGGEDYWYVRALEGEGKKTVLARFFDRIYIYATGVIPIGAKK